MFRKISYRVLLSLAVLAAAGASLYAQDGSYGGFSPYSIYGVGRIANPGSAYSRSMAGVGIASRTTGYLNLLNPASVSAKDSLAFMVDFSLYSDNSLFRKGNGMAAKNVSNIGDLAMSFPLSRTMGLMVGIQPYSDTGFEYAEVQNDPDVTGVINNTAYTATGNGSIYKGFFSAGMTFFKRISAGLEADYYFGNISKNYVQSFTEGSLNPANNTTTLQLSAFSGKMGLQYEQPVGSRMTIGLGTTYSAGAKIKGQYEDKKLSGGSSLQDTLSYMIVDLDRKSGICIASEKGLGVSVKYGDKWMVELDYTRSDWRNSGIGKISDFTSSSSPFSPSVSEAYRLGFEIVPNRNDIRYYFNRVAYRGGAYYRTEYYTVKGRQIRSAGITLGMSLPVYNRSNFITLGAEFGQRGSLRDDLLRERYFNFCIGINLYDIWFQKHQYH